MRRREFIVLLGGAEAACLAARAEQVAMPVIGFVRSNTLRDASHLVSGLRSILRGHRKVNQLAVPTR
jgi:hypothetical protein